jgi:phosphoribosylformylglycinamidine synthase
MKKATVTVMLKKGVLDPQGKAIGHALESLGFNGVGEVRQGKIITIDIPDDTTEESLRDMCEKLLANPVIEDYEVDLA